MVSEPEAVAPSAASAESAPSPRLSSTEPTTAPAVSAAPSAPAAQPAQVTTASTASPPAAQKKPGLFGRVFGSGVGDNSGVEVASATRAKDGGVLVTTKEGAVWHQVDLTDVPDLPKPGDRMSITDSLFGQHLCQYGISPIFNCRSN